MTATPATAARPWHVPMTGRDPGEAHRASTPLELLFDLCFVIAVGQAARSLHHDLAGGLLGHAIVGYLFVFFTIWWPWVNFTWFASAFDTDDVLYRLLTFVQIVGILIVAAGVPSAFTNLDLRIGLLGYVVMRIALVAQWLRVARQDPVHRRVALRFATAIAVIQVFWVLRLAVPDPLGFVLILVLGLVELSVPVWGERAGPPTPWHAGHMSERYGLFTIIVIGECLLAATTTIQATFEQDGLSTSLAAIAAGGLLLVFGLWWSYFKDTETLRRDDSLPTAIAWGYGHYVIFAAVAAIGVGLQLAAESTQAEGALAPIGVSAAVAIPVIACLVAVGVLHGRSDPRRAMRLTVVMTAAILVAGASVGVVGVPLAVLAMGVIVAGMIVWHVQSVARRLGRERRAAA